MRILFVRGQSVPALSGEGLSGRFTSSDTGTRAQKSAAKRQYRTPGLVAFCDLWEIERNYKSPQGESSNGDSCCVYSMPRRTEVLEHMGMLLKSRSLSRFFKNYMKVGDSNSHGPPAIPYMALDEGEVHGAA